MGEFQLCDRIIDARDGHGGVADQAVGCDRAVVVGQEGVVGADHRAVDLAIGDGLDEARCEDRREENLGIEAVLVLLAQALLGITGTFGRAAVLVVVGGAPPSAPFEIGLQSLLYRHNLSFWTKNHIGIPTSECKTQTSPQASKKRRSLRSIIFDVENKFKSLSRKKYVKKYGFETGSANGNQTFRKEVLIKYRYTIHLLIVVVAGMIYACCLLLVCTLIIFDVENNQGHRMNR